MIRVEKIDCTNFNSIQDIISEIWSSNSDEKARKIFEYQWKRDETHCGLVLRDGNRTVGFLGMIFSRRRIDDEIEKFCNLTSWFVKDEYRSRAISLLLPLFHMKEYTITDLTPAKKVYKIQNKLGFKDLDGKGRILMPFGSRWTRPRLSEVCVLHDPVEIGKKLRGENLAIFKDHQILACSHILLTCQDRLCYMIYTRRKRKYLPYVHVHYISDPELFALADREIRKSIMSHCRAYFILIDSRFVEPFKLPFSFCVPYRAPKQYLSSRLKPKQIDNLYSELILLNLKTNPRLKYLIRDLSKKIFRPQ